MRYMSNFMNLKDLANESTVYEQKTLKNNSILEVESFEAIDAFSDNYENIENAEESNHIEQSINQDDSNNEVVSQSNEEIPSQLKQPSCKPRKIENFINTEESLIENFEVTDTKKVAALSNAIGTVTESIKPLSKEVIVQGKAIVAAANSPEMKEAVGKTIEDYFTIARDSITKVFADPDHQHRIDEYVVKPIWDLYVIPFIDMYVIFLILYYIIFIITVIWLLRSKA